MNESERWIFLVGCTKSGNTMLTRFLATHPDVASMPREGHMLNSVLRNEKVLGLERCWALAPMLFTLDETDENVDAIELKRQLTASMNYPRRLVKLDKSPVNITRVRWLQAHFPDARFVYTRRNPYAVSEGMSRKESGVERGGASKRCRHKFPIALAAFQWRTVHETWIDARYKLKKWYEIQYEDLCARPCQILESLLAFCGLDGWPSVVDPDRLAIGRDGIGRLIRSRDAWSIARLSSKEKFLIRSIVGPIIDIYNGKDGIEK